MKLRTAGVLMRQTPPSQAATISSDAARLAVQARVERRASRNGIGGVGGQLGAYLRCRYEVSNEKKFQPPALTFLVEINYWRRSQ